MSTEVGNIDFLNQILNPKLEEFGKTLICWDCKTPLPEENEQYQHLNLWPLCSGCAEMRELRKIQIFRMMLAKVPRDA